MRATQRRVPRRAAPRGRRTAPHRTAPGGVWTHAGRARHVQQILPACRVHHRAGRGPHAVTGSLAGFNTCLMHQRRRRRAAGSGRSRRTHQTAAQRPSFKYTQHTHRITGSRLVHSRCCCFIARHLLLFQPRLIYASWVISTPLQRQRNFLYCI